MTVQNSLDRGVKPVQISHGKITILNVVEPVSIPSDMILDSKQRQIVSELQFAPRSFKKIMYKKMEKHVLLCKREKIMAVIKITHGNPDEEILRCRDDNSFDLIVMAKKKDLDDKSFLNLGGNTRKILEHVSCPILIIGNEKKEI